MNTLRVVEYDRQEQEAIALLPNRVVEAYQPVIFNMLGYPWRVRKEEELFKYVDVMHELRLEAFWNLLGGLTQHEFDLLKQLTERIYAFSKESFGKEAIARGSVLQAVNVYRHIRYLFGEERPRIFEMGPGCGYFAALLMLTGHPYAGVDISQAFYLYQNRFWDFLFPNKSFEGVLSGESQEALKNVSNYSAVHVPWWEFVKMRPDTAPSFDVVTCNHALTEMHSDSLGFSLFMCKFLLRGDEKSKKVFVFEGFGWANPGDQERVVRSFHDFGFVMVHHDSQITVFVPRGTWGDIRPAKFPRRVRPRLNRYRNLLRWLAGGRSLRGCYPYEPFVYSSLENPMSKAILMGRSKDEAARTVKIEEVNRFYTELLGRENHLSPDEEFWEMVGHPRG